MSPKFKMCINVMLMVAWTACKPALDKTQSKDGGRKQFSELFATSQSEMRNRGNYFYALFNKDYELRLDPLPKSGEVEASKTPYVGSWYPQKSGGTSRDQGSGSVLQKYDKVFNNAENKALLWEQTNHTVTSSNPASSWSGHCNGFSAASSRHLEPKSNVTRGDVIFTPKDIKALLAEIYMSTKYYFLGGNRCAYPNGGVLPGPSTRSDLYYLGECDDVNPGTFHTAIANWIGIQKHAVIMDLGSKEQVWNYPHFKYVSVIQTKSASEAMKEIKGVAEPVYSYNPLAKSFAFVTTTVTYSRAFENEYLHGELADKDRSASKVFTYILELDGEGRILGGEWTGESVQTHPDFVWVAFEPVIGDGTATSSNPHVNPDEVIKLWAESVGQDPANPALDIKEPAIAKEWGRFPKFDLSINNGRHGTVFLGGSQVVLLERKEPLKGDFTVELILDGLSVAKTNVTGNGNVSLPVDAFKPGIHSLEIRWMRAAETVDLQRVKVHAL